MFADAFVTHANYHILDKYLGVNIIKVKIDSLEDKLFSNHPYKIILIKIMVFSLGWSRILDLFF